jgi:6-phosphogluconolactonase
MASAERQVFSSSQELFRAAAQEFTRLANQATREHGSFSVALSGGSTPKALYSLLAAAPALSIPWDKIFFFWGDERHVPPDDAESNYRMVDEALLSRVPVPPGNIFRMPSENPDAAAAASAYEQTLRSFFRLKPGELPRVDLILLGMGPDGHTASLFPQTQALQERSRLAVANWVEKFKTYRITLTLPVLNNAACVMFLVTGADKASALASVFDDRAAPDEFPAKLVQPRNGRLIWLLGQDAAASLPG